MIKKGGDNMGKERKKEKNFVKCFTLGKQATLVVSIPKPIRETLKLKKGDYLEVETDGKRIILTPIGIGDKIEEVDAY